MNNKQISKLSIILFLIFTCVLAPSLVFAGDTPQPDTLSRIVDYFYTQTKSWASVIEGKAISLFAILLLIDVAWLGIRLAIKRSSITETLTEFTQLILFAGFMYGLITHYTDWTASFVEGLLGVAKDIGAPKAEPAAIFGTGISLISTAFSKISYTNLSVSVGLVISSIIICICFAMISAQLILVRCESYIVLNAGMILLGFGGSAFTKEFAFNFMKYALSVAVKLYVMQLLVALGLSFFTEITKGDNLDLQSFLVIIGITIVILSLVMSLPDIAAGIINGSHVSSGRAITSAVTAVSSVTTAAIGGGVAAAVGGARGVSALREASKYANSEGATGLKKMGHMASTLYGAAKDSKNPSFSRKFASSVKAKHEASQMNQSSKNKSDE